MAATLQCSESAAVAGLSGEALLRWRRQQLALGGRAVDLDWLLDLVGGLRWADLQRLRLDQANPVTLQVSLSHLEGLWRRHLSRQDPLQYLAGCCPWRDLNLAVAPGVLIPRQETELLVELARDLPDDAPGLWADLGTGSGCLALALALLWPRSRGVAVDLSPAALAQARANLAAGGVADRVEPRAGSWWHPLRSLWGQLELVVANPPYIPTSVWADLEPVVRDHEPALALDGGADGLGAIRVIASGAAAALAPGGWLLLEHHHDQATEVATLLRGAGLEQVEGHRDLQGVLRFASARRPLRID
ncbi:peptide chain release factor N(5)-glutamine methyltransferase [Cyanobium sp. CH-040]|uniref:peptide chain release factor N(5)-glutamine methyltransferase n=1 Tax=Cyanobium sp. CH-040 TaxID=2823708 RepID=UPI0020CD52EB|nr:peptide chain release factor N(5)-glutamine methyltransferase [Cyanobium sp. CH-040]